MPWGDLVKLLGGSTFILALLAFFWKGDDCISKEFRDDLAAWLILLKPPPGNSPVAQSVLAIFEKVFGDRHWSWKCYTRSFLVSTAFACSILFFQLMQIDEARMGMEKFYNDFSLNLSWWIPATATPIILFNAFSDIFALYVTRRVLVLCAVEQRVKFLSAVVVDYLFTSIIIGFTCLLFLLPVAILTDATFPMHAFTLPLVFLGAAISLPAYLFGLISIGSNEVEYFFSVLYRTFVFTAFITSFWLWAAALGTLIIRLLARSGPILNALQYALPIEEKPIRSMGIVGFLVFFLYLLVTIVVRSI